MRAGFIGAGKVGFTLGKYLAMHGIEISGYYSRTPASAKEAAEFTQSRYYTSIEEITKDSDTLFLTVPDGTISEIWDDMRNLPIKNKNICHCSGSISSTVFFDAEDKGACAYSVHPLYAVSDRYHSYKKLRNAVFSVEGSEKNLDVERFLKKSSIEFTKKNQSITYIVLSIDDGAIIGGITGNSADNKRSCHPQP